MTVVLPAVGALLVLVALLDVAWTTVAAGSGAGPLTGRSATAIWRVALAVHHRRASHRMLAATGLVVVFAVIATWLVLVLTGWTLVFGVSDGAVRSTATGRPADLVERMYFVGYSVLTLGNGDYRPGRGLWQLTTVLATGTGLVLITLSITYLVPVASALADRRRLGNYIASLGRSPHEIVVRSWDGHGFGSLVQHLVALVPLLHAARQQHLTYPVLHFLHSRHRESAAAPSITDLSQALHLLRLGVARSVRPDAAALDPLDRAIESFLETLRGAHLRTAFPPLPLPDLDPLRAAGIPVVDEHAYVAGGPGSEHRRALLAALMVDDGWSRPEPHGPPQPIGDGGDERPSAA